jgi:outer membrane protein TolC
VPDDPHELRRRGDRADRHRRRGRARLQNLVVTSSREAFRLAETRLREGTVTVLQTQQTVFTAEDQQVVARLARLQAVLSLFQALGGAWLPPCVAAGTNVLR